MKLAELLSRIGSVESSLGRDPNKPDSETDDQSLRSLRRLHRKLVEEPAERRALEASIARERKSRDRGFLLDDGAFFGGRNILREDRTILSPVSGKKRRR